MMGKIWRFNILFLYLQTDNELITIDNNNLKKGNIDEKKSFYFRNCSPSVRSL